MNPLYSYAAEKFSTAQTLLDPPYPRGEVLAIRSALQEISFGLDNLNRDSLDDYARTRIRRLDELMNIDGLDDPDKEGLFLVKARLLSHDEKWELSKVVNELAVWFQGGRPYPASETPAN